VELAGSKPRAKPGLWLKKGDNFCQKINNICKILSFILAVKLQHFLDLMKFSGKTACCKYLYHNKRDGILLALPDNKQKQKIGPVINSNLKREVERKNKRRMHFKLT